MALNLLPLRNITGKINFDISFSVLFEILFIGAGFFVNSLSSWRCNRDQVPGAWGQFKKKHRICYCLAVAFVWPNHLGGTIKTCLQNSTWQDLGFREERPWAGYCPMVHPFVQAWLQLWIVLTEFSENISISGPAPGSERELETKISTRIKSSGKEKKRKDTARHDTKEKRGGKKTKL